MPESFDCPRCGAPLHFDGEQQSSKETITCPYCGESVIVPESLRPNNPQVINLGETFRPEVIELDALSHSTVITLDTEAPARTGQSAKKWIGTCAIIGILIIGIVAIASIFTFGSIKNSLSQAFNPVKTNPVSLADNQVATMVARVTQMLADLTDTPEPAPTAALDTPTPPVNITATAQAEATLAAQNVLAEEQRNWPVVLQEKFTHADLNWNIGTNNDEYALEDITIADNKYTWKLTTKQSMGSFTFPDMQPLADMLVSVDMQLMSSSAYDDDQAGIIFRSSPKDHSFYFFGVNPKGSYMLSMYDGNNWNDLIPFTPTDQLKPNQVNHLAVSIQGNQILLMINNRVVNGFEDAQLSSGGAGLGVEITSAGVDATLIYTNFVIRAPKP